VFSQSFELGYGWLINKLVRSDGVHDNCMLDFSHSNLDIFPVPKTVINKLVESSHELYDFSWWALKTSHFSNITWSFTNLCSHFPCLFSLLIQQDVVNLISLIHILLLIVIMLKFA
jgi:hypothetical protein